MLLAFALFLIGLASLLFGAKLLVSGASGLALTFGISSLAVGLTVVAFGTSAPEIAISLVGAWRGEGGLVVGNIIGSNLFNILLVLGAGATFTPLIVKRRLIWWDVPLMIAATLFFWAVSAAGQINRVEGAILFASILVYLVLTFIFLKKEPPEKPSPARQRPTWVHVLWIIIGLGLLAVGSELLVRSATEIAHYFGLSELLIGLTIVAVGTSLPELATLLSALKKGETDIAVGSIVGSNLFNLLAVVGLAALFSPTPIEIPQKAVVFDLPILVGVSIATLPIFLTGHLISRWEGLLFLFYYCLYLVFLIMERNFIHYLPYFTTACIFFILPLTLLTLLIGVARHFRQKG
ncbi:MAG: hypothetical protein S4CHLAM2_13030 [Chlamydiales bacterium]|nr:hypothetical protein [Chlamydiales bacterium]